MEKPRKGDLTKPSVQPEAYLEGVWDHEDGIPVCECPYHRVYSSDIKPVNKKSSQRQQWFTGWYDSYFHRKYPNLFPYPVKD